jgi:hypothetical protein
VTFGDIITALRDLRETELTRLREAIVAEQIRRSLERAAAEAQDRLETFRREQG